ncbi:hypothetical protein [Flavobacterium suncheonense]|uniref:hypothetical protein n=1 Tax=Flavobacterium suncheonense TaxID=350894 RepID=UPI003FA34CFB
MKKVIAAAGFSLLILAACKDKEKQIEPETETAIESVKEEGPTHAEAVTDSAAADGTSVSVSSEGVKISDKEGDKKVEVKATKEGASVEVKK